MIYGYLSGSVNPGSAGQFIYTSAVCAVCAVIAVFLYECGFRAATGKSPENSLLRSAFCGKNMFCMAVTAFFGYCGLTPRRDSEGIPSGFFSSLAGPFFCLVAGAVSAGLWYGAGELLYSSGNELFGYFSIFFGCLAKTCGAVAVFNILPVPNLAGGDALSCLMSGRLREKWLGIDRGVTFFICCLIIVLLWRSGNAEAVRSAVVSPIVSLLEKLFA